MEHKTETAEVELLAGGRASERADQSDVQKAEMKVLLRASRKAAAKASEMAAR